MNAFFYETSIGKVMIVEDNNAIVEVSVIQKEDGINYELEETELMKEAYRQLNEYLEGKRTEFKIALNPKGTVFQKKVWDVLRQIPYGETWSYKKVAEAIGNPNASRAVGMANHYNPIMIMIPCHRVIGANGSMVGYAGGLTMKEKLLQIEHRKGSNENE
ncbi:MAG: ogt [Herbinix sp.]|nr:ogt [Herbinix sp.]